MKTTGGKGLHVVAPIKPGPGWSACVAFARRVVDLLVAETPRAFVATMAKSARKGKIFIDYFRNQRGATSVAAYSTRARPGAPVSTPVTWEELDSVPSGSHFTLATVERRLAKLSRDPWAGYETLSSVACPRPGAPRRSSTRAASRVTASLPRRHDARAGSRRPRIPPLGAAALPSETFTARHRALSQLSGNEIALNDVEGIETSGAVVRQTAPTGRRTMARYSRGAGKAVKSAMRRRKKGTLRSGSGKRVTSRKQAIAIGLSEAREKGARVPRKSK